MRNAPGLSHRDDPIGKNRSVRTEGKRVGLIWPGIRAGKKTKEDKQMKKVIAGVVVVLLVGGVVLVSGTAFAAKKAYAAESGQKVKTHVVNGTVEAVDAATGKITVKTKKGSEEIVCGSTCKMEMKGKSCTMADVAVGDKVTAKCKGTDCVSLKVAKPKAAAKK
jgi:Cu/Ag efflux protein CusF